MGTPAQGKFCFLAVAAMCRPYSPVQRLSLGRPRSVTDIIQPGLEGWVQLSRTRRRFWARSRNSGPGFVVSDRHGLSDTRRQHRTQAKGRRAISARLTQCFVTPPDALAGFAGGGVVETLWASLLVFPTLLAFAVLFGFAGVPAVVAFFGRDFLAG